MPRKATRKRLPSWSAATAALCFVWLFRFWVKGSRRRQKTWRKRYS